MCRGALPIAYEELTLTRRLHRSGESEYFINGNPVRLKDVQNLFLDSGVGRNAFSIFEQGKLDQVISYTPLERRHIFEEAAGILRFLQRKKESLKRLEQADLNLSRVQDIHQEVEKQIQTLQVQAEKALRFKEQQKQLECLEKTSYLLRWNGLEKKKEDVRVKKNKQEEQLILQQQTLSAKQAQSLEMKGLIQVNEKILRAKHEELFKARNEKELHVREHQANQQRLQEIQQKERKIKRELEELALAKQSRRKALQDIQRSQARLAAEFEEVQSKLSFQQDKVKFKEKEVLELRQELQMKQQNHVKGLQQNNQLVSDMKQAEVRLENNEERNNQFKKRREQIGEESKQLALMIQEKKKQLQHISGLVDSHKDRLDQYEEELKLLAKQQESEQKQLEAVKKKWLELKARQKVLIRMREDHEGFSSGSKKLLLEAQNEHSPFHQKIRPLYEFLEPEPEAAEAVAVILRTYAQTLVVETEKDLEDVIAFADQTGLQDYSLVSLETIQRECSGSLNLTDASLLAQVAINLVAKHFLSHIDIFSSHQEALRALHQLDRREGWSLQKAFFDYRSVFFKVKPSENQVFLREAELKSVEEELGEKERQTQELEQKVMQLQHRKAQLQLERTEQDKMLRRDEMKLVEVNFGLQRALSDQEKLKLEQAQAEQHIEVLNQQIDQQKLALKALQDKYFIDRQELVGQEQACEVLQAELDKQEGVLRLQHQDQKEKGNLYRQLAENQQQLLHQSHLLEAKEQDQDMHAQHLTEELFESQQLQAQCKQKEAHYQPVLEVIEKRCGEAETIYQQVEQACETIKKSLEEVEQLVFNQQGEVKKIELELNQLSILEAQLQSTAQALVEELKERHELSIDQLKQFDLPLNKSLEQTEKAMRSLRQFLQSQGDINLTAIEELEKQQVRFDFLKQQLGDMQKSKEELLQIITQLDGECRFAFKETFEAIKANFKKNFQILFNGGEADLLLTETTDILEAGIEISAKPPGKQMRSISLLSGGEKCLTAVALLFAIFEVKPAPFCILDEIDAPLDDSNVERFVNVVKHFVDRCQFLIITHNKRTMAIGDVLFGVSMEEKGVSKLLSLEFAHEAKPDVALV